MLGTSGTIDVDAVATLEEYVCCMYGLKSAQRTNNIRLQLYKKKTCIPQRISKIIWIKLIHLIHASYHPAEQFLVKN